MNNKSTRIVTFPADYSLGKLSLLSQVVGERWIDFGEARGDIAVPMGRDLCLSVSRAAGFDSQIFSTLQPDALSVFTWVCTSEVTDADIAYIRHLTALKGVALWETDIGDEALWYLRQLPNLQWLDIGDTQVTDAGLSSLSEMPLLSELSLLNTNITDAGLCHLKKLSSLKHIDLMNTDVSDKGVSILKNLTKLRNLRIYHTNITENAYRELRRALPRCEIWFYRSNNL